MRCDPPEILLPWCVLHFSAYILQCKGKLLWPESLGEGLCILSFSRFWTLSMERLWFFISIWSEWRDTKNQQLCLLSFKSDLKIREYLTINHRSGRYCGLMVSALDSEASGLRLSPGRGHYVVFLGKTQFTITVPLSSLVYKWVPVNCWGNLTKLRGSDLLASRLGEVEILPAASCCRKRDKLRQLWANLQIHRSGGD